MVEWFEQTPAWTSASVLRTLLTVIFEHSPDRATAQSRLQLRVEQAAASGLVSFYQFINSLNHWHDGMFNDFEGGHTSGFVKGLNNKLKLLKRRCFGLDDPTRRFRRLWLDIEGSRLWA